MKHRSERQPVIVGIGEITQRRKDLAQEPLALMDQGPATLETHTMICERDGQPRHGVAIARTPEGGRVLARVSADQRATIAALTDLDAVGRPGQVSRGDDGIPEWRIET